MGIQEYAIRQLDNLTVRNTDDGKKFIDTSRLDRIERELKDSPYRYCEKGKLFHAYARVPFEKLDQDVIVITSHVDFKRGTEKCFAKVESDVMVGTFDNSITNAAILSLMKEDPLPRNTVVVFTGDEEEGSGGAKEFARLIRKKWKKHMKAIVLDVTSDGLGADASFTIENGCFTNDKTWGRKILSWAEDQKENWRFVPYKKADLQRSFIKDTISGKNFVKHRAGEDEAYIFKKKDCPGFSFCLPAEFMDPAGVFAPDGWGMHSPNGLRVKKEKYFHYIRALREVILVVSAA